MGTQAGFLFVPCSHFEEGMWWVLGTLGARSSVEGCVCVCECSWVSKSHLSLDFAPGTGLGARARVLVPSDVGLHDFQLGKGGEGLLACTQLRGEAEEH